MFYFRKNELRQFASFLDKLASDRPWVFYPIAIAFAAGLGLALTALFFPAGSAAALSIASYFSLPILANSPILLAAVAFGSTLWMSIQFAIFFNWLIAGDTWRSIKATLADLKQDQPILYYGIVASFGLSISLSIYSWFLPTASLSYLVIGLILPPLIKTFGLLATLFTKSLANVIEDEVFSGSSAVISDQRPPAAPASAQQGSAPVYYLQAAQPPGYSIPAGSMIVPMPVAQAYPGASHSSRVDGAATTYQPVAPRS